jgi:hypothetical protein
METSESEGKVSRVTGDDSIGRLSSWYSFLHKIRYLGTYTIKSPGSYTGSIGQQPDPPALHKLSNPAIAGVDHPLGKVIMMQIPRS